MSVCFRELEAGDRVTVAARTRAPEPWCGAAPRK